MKNQEISRSELQTVFDSLSDKFNEINDGIEVGKYKNSTALMSDINDFNSFFLSISEPLKDKTKIKGHFDQLSRVLQDSLTEIRSKETDRNTTEFLHEVWKLEGLFGKIRTIEGSDLTDEEIYNMVMEESDEEFEKVPYYAEFIAARKTLNLIKNSCSF